MPIELNSTSLLSDANLQGYWRLEANGTDSGPNGYTIAAGTVPSYVTGKFGNGADFEASSSQYLTIADASCPNLEISGSQTWGCWVKPESFAANASVMSKHDSGVDNWRRIFINTSGNVQWGTSSGLTGTNNIACNFNISTGVWSFIVGVYDSTAGLIKIFVNGIKKEASATGSMVDTNSDFSIGRSGERNQEYFDGIIEDAFIFNRALTDTEISGLYHSGLLVDGNWPTSIRRSVDATKVAGSSNHTNFPALISSANLSAAFYTALQSGEINDGYLLSDTTLKAYYRFEGGALTTDSSGEGNTLTNTNTVGEGTGVYGGDADFSSSNTNKALQKSSYVSASTSNFSMGCWVKPSNINQFSCIVQNGSDGGGEGLFIGASSGSGTGALLLGLNSGVAWLNSSFSFTAGGWAHIVLTNNGTTTKIYANNQLVYSGTPTSFTAVTNFFTIGAQYNGAGSTLQRFFSGEVDDAFFIDRVLTDADIKAIYTGGADLRITTDSAGVTEIPFEIVTLDTGANTCEIWTKIPTLDFDDNTPIYLWAGNANAIPYEANATFGSQAVWTSGEKARYHYQGNALDSTANANNLTQVNTPTFATAQIGNGIDFELSSSEYAYIADNASLDITTEITIRGWVKPESLTGFHCILIKGRDSGGSVTNYSLDVGSTGYLRFYYYDGSGYQIYTTSSNALSTGTLYRLAVSFTFGTGSSIKVFVNDTLVSGSWTTGNGNSAAVANSLRLQIGVVNSATTPADFYDGLQDEFGIYAGILSADWLDTEYNNQNDPGTFWIASIAYTKNLTDTATLSETLVKATTRFLSETATLTEMYSDIKGRGLAFLDNIGLTEVLNKAMTRILSETATLTEVFTKIKAKFVSFVDSFSGLTEVFSTIKGQFMTLTDTTTLSETLIRVKGMILSETATLTEVFSTLYGRFMTLTDAFSGLVDTLQKNMTRSLSDTVTMSDVIRRYLNGLLFNLWTKVAKPAVGVWTKIVKPTGSWTKTSKPTGTWTKRDKPY